jgi:diaminopimelate epimerase
MWLNFTKMHGLGNDFVVLDGVTQHVKITPSQARKLADRHFGIACDQILLVEPPSDPDVDFDYRIFNQDGSEVSQCGNGARCFAKFVRDRRLTHKECISVRTASGRMEIRVNPDHSYSVDLAIPRFAPSEIPLLMNQQADTYHHEIDGQKIEFSAMSLGNPHMVIQVDDTATAPVQDWGEHFQHDELFPQRVNVGFMKILNRGEINLRVYERGAGETLACGSGACAAAIAGIRLGLLDGTVLVNLPGGQLKVEWRGEGEPVRLSGPAKTVFNGKIRWQANQTKSGRR